MLDALDLDDLRSDAVEAMPDTAVITRPAPPSSPDPYGSTTETWQTVLTTRCRVDTANTLPSERILGGRVAAESRPVLVVPGGTDVRATDRAQVTFFQTGAVVTYELIDIYAPRSYEITRRALLQQT